MKTASLPKTNAMRILDTLAIPYEFRTYEVDLDDLTAINVAHKIGLPPEQVFKTLLLQASNGDHLFAVIPGDVELDLKKAAQTVGVKKVELAVLKEVELLTGYVRGGVTVLAAKKAFPTYVDKTIELFHMISVSAGMRGVQVLLAPTDYLWACGGVVADLTRGLP